MGEKYYKILNPDGKSPTTNFDYSAYLPSGEKSGKWLPTIENAQIRKSGYYATKYWFMWFAKGLRIFEVELDGTLEPEERGTRHQVCGRSMRFVADVTEELLADYFERVKSTEQVREIWNVGNTNTGSGNMGNGNAGDFNVGSRNTGKRNAGDFNTGDCNTGIDNVGDDNLGSANAGSHNDGHSNTGDFNKGSYNSGSHNVGHKNSGSYNVGNSNSGKWNKTNFHTGYFNTEPAPIFMFNKKVNIKISDLRFPAWLNSPNLKQAFESAPEEQVRATLALPNFDFDVFFQITGISRADFEKKLGEF